MHLILHYAMFSHIFSKKINKFNLYTNIKEKTQLQWFCAPANKILTKCNFYFWKICTIHNYIFIIFLICTFVNNPTQTYGLAHCSSIQLYIFLLCQTIIRFWHLKNQHACCWPIGLLWFKIKRDCSSRPFGCSHAR